MDKEYFKNYKYIIGVDEVGRGPLAGPVNACALMLTHKDQVDELKELKITDSKKLNLNKRKKILDHLGIEIDLLKKNKLFDLEIAARPAHFVISEQSPKNIDRINILQASLRAMEVAIEKLPAHKDTIALIDGNKLCNTILDSEAIIKGDSKLVCIGLASIIAKSFRDELMQGLAKKYPGYYLEKNAGYPTKEHRLAIEEKGITPIHRKSFKGVKEFI